MKFRITSPFWFDEKKKWAEKTVVREKTEGWESKIIFLSSLSTFPAGKNLFHIQGTKLNSDWMPIMMGSICVIKSAFSYLSCLLNTCVRNVTLIWMERNRYGSQRFNWFWCTHKKRWCFCDEAKWNVHWSISVENVCSSGEKKKIGKLKEPTWSIVWLCVGFNIIFESAGREIHFSISNGSRDLVANISIFHHIQ